MTWANFYLLCFLVGLGMSALSFLLGAFNIHVPHIHVHGGGMHGGPGGHIHFHAPHGHAPAGAANGPGGGYVVSPFNISTGMAFLAWFGGAGYLLTRYSSLEGIAALLFSVLAGLTGGAIVFWFMAKVLYSPDEDMDPADYEMVGTLGKTTITVRQGGTGEIVYVQGGSKKTAAARSESGEAIQKGSEVVVTKYEKGIAYVRRWEELAGEGHTDSTAAAQGGADQN